MSSSMCVSLLFIVIVCLNNSAYVTSIPYEADSNNHTDINILFISMVNNLPPNSERLSFVGTGQSTEYELLPGKPYTEITNFDLKTCLMIWQPLCASFNRYDPSREGNHQRIYWSIRKDGIYHSWDNVNWDKRTGWVSCKDASVFN
uniref:S-protein homolog n=1 Tax=Cajanus cajan TaxID=3821 RepID=A0A151RX71_CAJCA|nr:hypothetical protein KK1_031297 [Cajanus cajan]